MYAQTCTCTDLCVGLRVYVYKAVCIHLHTYISPAAGDLFEDVLQDRHGGERGGGH